MFRVSVRKPMCENDSPVMEYVSLSTPVTFIPTAVFWKVRTNEQVMVTQFVSMTNCVVRKVQRTRCGLGRN